MLTDLAVGLWFSTVACAVAGVLTLVGAWRGSSQHRTARIVLGVAICAIAVTYLADCFGADPTHVAQVRRGVGWVLWPSIAWTAWSGMTYARRVDAAQRMLREGTHQ